MRLIELQMSMWLDDYVHFAQAQSYRDLINLLLKETKAPMLSGPLDREVSEFAELGGSHIR